MTVRQKRTWSLGTARVICSLLLVGVLLNSASLKPFATGKASRAPYNSLLKSCTLKATRISSKPLISQSTIGLHLPYPKSPQFQFPSFFWDDWALGLPHTPFPGVPSDAVAVALFGRHEYQDMIWGWTTDYLTFNLGSGEIPVSWSDVELDKTVYEHISSPELFIDQAKNEIWLAFHYCCLNTLYTPLPLSGATEYAGLDQATMVAKWNSTSKRFIIHETKAPVSDQNTRAYNAAIAPFYLRIFIYKSKFYGIAKEANIGSLLLRALNDKVTGPYRVVKRIIPHSRHVGLLLDGSNLYVGYTRLNEIPERARIRVVDLSGSDPMLWNFDGPETVLLTPNLPWEGTNKKFSRPRSGPSFFHERNLRDATPFFDRYKDMKLSYCGGGEFGIAVANISCS